MPTLVSGYEYDIFISYRHNDNRSGWVTEFVKALGEELAATIKEPVSVYFDTNPHDGLLETHNVDKSLEGKLKCLIFIPIISQTYCDPKSFAWQHEFCAFNKLVKEDRYGRDIKLINGNVASRVLPIKIHDLDTQDKTLLENELGGVLRAIEFIFRSPGVNRPLNSSDKREENSNKIFYRDQVNKVANAIKEIIAALNSPVLQSPRIDSHHHDRYRDNTSTTNRFRIRNSFVVITSLVLLLSIIAYVVYPKLISSTNGETILDKSIAVLPFVDLSESKDQGWFGDGLTEEILNSLAHVKGLNVISRTSSFAFKGMNIRIQTIADSLHVNYIVEGSVRKSNSGLRITAQLIRAKDGFHIWSNSYDRNSKDIFALQQEIAAKIAESLDILLDPKAIEQMQWAGTTNPEAFLAFLKGQGLFSEGHIKRSQLLPYLKRANINFDEAIRLDPDFINPYFFRADFYFHYLLKNEQTEFNDTITEVQAYQLMRTSIERAIDKSKSEIEKDYYRLYSIMHSNDWSAMRPIIERVLKSPDAVHLFTYQPFNLAALLTCLGYGEQITSISQGILKNDPLNSAAKRQIIEAMIFSGNYNKAIESIDSMISFDRDGRFNYDKLFCLYQLKRVDEVYNLLKQLDSTTVGSYHSILAMVFAKRGKLKEAKQIMDKDSRDDYTLHGIEAAYGRAAANSEATKLDEKLVMHHVLLFSYLLSPKNLPFDISAAPNFAKRLRQAGIDIKQNH